MAELNDLEEYVLYKLLPIIPYRASFSIVQLHKTLIKDSIYEQTYSEYSEDNYKNIMFFLTEYNFAWGSPPNDEFLILTDEGILLKDCGNYPDYIVSKNKQEEENDRRRKLEDILLENNVTITKFQKSAGFIVLIAGLIIALLSLWISFLSYKLNSQTFHMLYPEQIHTGIKDSLKSNLPIMP